MTELRSCEGCKRRVYVTEASCPFCSAQLAPARPVPSSLRPGMSRAQMLAVAAAAVSSQALGACSDGQTTLPGTSGEGGAGGQVPSGQAGEAGVDGNLGGSVANGGVGVVGGNGQAGDGQAGDGQAGGGQAGVGSGGFFSGVGGVYGGAPGGGGFIGGVGGMYGGAFGLPFDAGVQDPDASAEDPDASVDPDAGTDGGDTDWWWWP